MNFLFRKLHNTVKFSCRLSVLWFILLSNPLFSQETLSHILQKVEAKYKNMKSLSMNFTKEVKSPNFESKEKSRGKIWLKNPDKFRLDSEQEQLVSDGKIVWIYSKENKQVTKNRREKVKNIMEVNQLVSNFSTNYKTSLKGKEKVLDLPCWILELTPKSENEAITKLFLWVESKTFLIRKLEYIDISENKITLLFNQISPGAKISDKKFYFRLPTGVEFVDLTDIK